MKVFKEDSFFLNQFDFIDERHLALYPLNLNLHGPEEEGRTEDPTEYRKKKARDEEGRVFFTTELPQGALLIVAFSTLLLLSFYYNNILKELFVKYLGNLDKTFFTIESIGALAADVSWVMLKFIIPIGFIGIMTTVLATMMQTRFHVSTKQLRINFRKIVPSWDNFKKRTILTKTQVLNSVKIFLKVVIFSFITYFILVDAFADLSLLMHKSIAESYMEISWLVYKLVVVMSVIAIVLAIPDWFVQKSEFEESLKMTREEVKKEYKELEGDPLIKSKIRERAREIANREMMENVKTADVVITNPTHFSCAIKYSISEMDAPKLVAKGQDQAALRIREIAKEYDVPIVENKPLARSLYANVEVDSFIPVEYYNAIAGILGALEKYKGEVA